MDVRAIPDTIVLVRRLLADPRVPRRHKLALGALLAYLVSPIDLIPDFIPVIGLLDDVLIVVLVLRFVLRSIDDDLIEEHSPASRRRGSRPTP